LRNSEMLGKREEEAAIQSGLADDFKANTGLFE
jgi:hypothetical protein